MVVTIFNNVVTWLEILTSSRIEMEYQTGEEK